MATLFTLIGISGCGKSTFSKMLKDTVIVSSDAIREKLFGTEECQNDPGKVFKIAHERIKEGLENGFDVVFDATNVSRVYREETRGFIPVGTKSVGVVFVVEPVRALERQKNRERKVPEPVISAQWNALCNDAESIPDEFDELVVIS